MNHITLNHKKGFTILELLVSLILISIVVYPLSSLIKINNTNIENTNKMDHSIVNTLVSDMIFDTSIAVQIDYSIDFFEVKRLDGCIINYDYVPADQNILKVYSCPTGIDGKIRQIIVPNIESFQITRPDPKLFQLEIKKLNENFTHTYLIKSN